MIAVLRVWLKVGAAWMAALYLFGHLAAFMHTTLERHVVCSEHGDLMHSGDAPDDAHVQADSSDVNLKAAQPAGPSHQHCTSAHLLTFARVITQTEPLTLNEPFSVEPEFACYHAATPIRGPTVHVYRFAPKTSPPIA